ncbi:MAG: ATP-grasp domain-containing protein [Clostridiales bacterium]|nr:ATP-grasp domain-containing protein [Clostridiales bacterium]
MKTVMLTAVGSASAGPVTARYQALGMRVVGCDIYPRSWNETSQQVDEFFQALTVQDEEAYVQQMLAAVRRYGVEALIPLTDVEVDVLCSRKAEFLALGCVLCTPEEAVVRLCRDKQQMAQRLEAAQVCRTIPTFSGKDLAENLSFPMMLKPRSGRSSQGQVIAWCQADVDAALKRRDDYIAQPYLTGDIYTVDVARDVQGNVQTLVRRELLRTGNGLGTTVEVIPQHPLDRICADIAREAAILGVVNMEFIHHDDDFYFLEVNPRFSGGAGFSLKAGMDVALLMLRCHQGQHIGQRPVVQPGIYTRKIEIIGG